MQQPFNVSDDNINTLFKLLFQNVQDKNFKVFENKSDDEILSNLGNGNVCFNKTSDNMYLCVNINGMLKKINFNGSVPTTFNFIPDYSSGIDKTALWGQDVVAEKDGWIEFGAKIVADVNPKYLKCYIDNNQVILNETSGAGNDSFRFAHLIPIKKNSTYKVEGGNSSKSIFFYPIIGE